MSMEQDNRDTARRNLFWALYEMRDRARTARACAMVLGRLDQPEESKLEQLEELLLEVLRLARGMKERMRKAA